MTNIKNSTIIFGNLSEINKYRDELRVNQSSIKRLVSPYVVKVDDEKSLYYEEKSHFITGNAVDLLLTVGINAFLANFYISDIEKPSDAVMSIIHHVFDIIKNSDKIEITTDISKYSDIIINVAKEEKYRQSWGNSAILNYIISNGNSYFKLLIESNGKQIISKAENERIINVVKKYQKDSKYGYLFNVQLLQKFKLRGLIIMHQVPVYWTEVVNNVPIKCKGLIDTLVIDLVNKTIKIFDIKTTGDAILEFVRSIKQYRYDMQLAFYYMGLKSSIASGDFKIEDDDLTKYKFLNPSFLVASTVTDEDILEFEMSNSLLENAIFGKSGSVTPFGMRIYPIYGYRSALKAYLFYKEHGFSNTFISIANNRKLIISEHYDY